MQLKTYIIILILFSFHANAQANDSLLFIKIKALSITIQRELPKQIEYYDSTSKILIVYISKLNHEYKVDLIGIDDEYQNYDISKIEKIVNNILRGYQIPYKGLLIPIGIKITEEYDKRNGVIFSNQLNFLKSNYLKSLLIKFSIYLATCQVIYITNDESLF